MKPHVAKAAISALKWALGLSLGYILGPIVYNLACGVENTSDFIALRLVTGVFLFPVIFLVMWMWGIKTKNKLPADPQKAASAPKAVSKWNYAGIGAGIFMLLFLFVPEMLKGTLEKQYYLGGAFWIGVIILCTVNIIRAKK